MASETFEQNISSIENGECLINNNESKPKEIDLIQKVTDGFLNFKVTTYDKYPELYDQLAKDQDPKIMIFACVDSRVNLSIVLGLKHGEAFTVRNIANTIPAYNKLRYSGIAAALEYALTVLKVENILIMGHSECGGILRLMSDDNSISYDALDDWVSLALPAKAKVKKEFGHLPADEQRHICEREAVKLYLNNLLTYPDVKITVEKNELALWGSHFDFSCGKFELWKLDICNTTPIVLGA